MKFITLDFETATPDRHSPCELGLTFVEQGKIVETKSWLIKPPQYPYFDDFNTYIHGITKEHVSNKATFQELWPTIKPLLENQLVIAHNASFDMSVLRRTLEHYSIPFPELNYICSYIFSKKIWEALPSYDLKTLCRINGINLAHHRAGSDSKATAELALIALQKSDIQTAEDFRSKLGVSIGQLYQGGYKPSTSNRTTKKKILEFESDPSTHNPDSIFYGRTVVFTGTLSSMIRDDAQVLIAQTGGLNRNSVSKATDFLVVGQQDYRVVGDDGMSSKQRKAVKLVEDGSDIEILSEEDFLKSL